MAWDGNEQRSVQRSDVRMELMNSIAAADDPKDRSMLMLMLAVLNRVEELLADDKALQLKVLNGLTEHHAEDHAWLREFITEYEASAATKKSMFKKLAEGAMAQIGTIIVTALVTFLGVQAWLK